MNRFSIRLRVPRSGAAGLAAAAVAVAAALAGCGTGQIAQTTDQAAAVNGNEGVVGQVALRDVRIQAVQEGAFIEPGQTVELVFVATNQSTDTADELTGISTSIGKVSLTGGKQLPAAGVLVVGAPAGQDQVSPAALKDLHSVGNRDNASATVTLDKPISNGLTYDFTFHFREAGTIGLAVPISAAGATSTSAEPAAAESSAAGPTHP